ncbi:hypothetical protein FOA52_015839 [Chlamydomonas sp. UWO 241]|nr:hypothetical protein FOA52_015839 [Chlamydomonas sp. UWO 241]
MALAGGWLRAAHGLMSVAGAAVAEALAGAQEAGACGDSNGASAVVDAADAAHRFVRSLLEDTGRSNASSRHLADAVTRKDTTLALLCSPLAAKVMSLQPGVWRDAICAAKLSAPPPPPLPRAEALAEEASQTDDPSACGKKRVCECKALICRTDTAAKLLGQLDVRPNEHPSLLLPSLLVRVAQEMTLVCSSIVISVAQPELQAQQQQQQGLGLPSRRLPPVASEDDDSSEVFGSPLGSILGESSSNAWASVSSGADTSSPSGGMSSDCSRRHSSGGGALVEPANTKPLTSPECHSLGSARPLPQPQRERELDAQSRLRSRLDAAALHGELAVVEAIQAVRAATGAPVSNVRMGAATEHGMGIARYRPRLMCAYEVGVKQQQQQQQRFARPAGDGAPTGLIDALECAHKECNDLLSAVAHMLDAARPALLQVASEAAEAHGAGESVTSTLARARNGLSTLIRRLTGQQRGGSGSEGGGGHH